MVITKSDFELIISVATSAHMEVFEKVEPQFADTYERCKEDILGAAGTDAAEDGTHTQLTKDVKRWVSVHAFLSVFRQLDLVLTPTGFGVVSTQQMAPASKPRVDALMGHLRDSALQARGQLLAELCKVSGWKDAPQAHGNIDTLFYDFRLLQKMQGPAVSYLEWQTAQRLIAEADEELRRKISNQYMDALLDSVRSASVSEADADVINLCRQVFSLWISGDHEAVRLKMRRLLNLLDSNPDSYELYHQHGYPVNHHENFQNTEDAPAYVFVGLH